MKPLDILSCPRGKQIMDLFELKGVKKTDLNDLREDFLKRTNPDGELKVELNVPEVPKGKSIDKYFLELSPTEQRDFRKRIVAKVFDDITPLNQKAVIDKKVRNDVLTSTTIKFEPFCKVCSSMYYSVYIDWLTLQNRNPLECSKLALVCFGEEISHKSFERHLKNHAIDKKVLRRIMVLKDPQIQPRRIAEGMVQLLSEDIIQDDELSPAKAKVLQSYLKVLDDMDKTASKVPVIDSSTNLIQINNNSNVQQIPFAKDTKRVVEAQFTDEDNRRLLELEAKCKGRGTQKIIDVLPDHVPVVDPRRNSSGGNVINVGDDEKD